MDFLMGLPRPHHQHDSVWVIVDRMTKSAYFLPVHTSYSVENYAKLYIRELVRLLGVPLSIISDKDFLFPLWLVDKFGYASFLSQFVKLGIDPPKDVLCYGPPGTGKTLLARAVANRTDAYFIRVIGSEFVQKYIGEGARMMEHTKNGCIVFFDEVDFIRGARFDDRVGEDNEVQRTMLEIVNRLDGFDARGNI
ncbi:hypothetical protein T459_01899 [Capsicum annuum]|uniref:ATPase AAA-type core domain-containing protein n=1 Tax=Capsicum annuum TaxID=4072 RepID=A0A2G3AIE8_CAPAN|nr:hypothetical protein T459_01899 [Capsicum annuum]